MVTKENKKQFALEQIAPYYHNPLLCSISLGSCYYYSPSGKKCVAGKNLVDPKRFKNTQTCIESLIGRYGEDIFKPESRDKLSSDEWQYLQFIHDNIARHNHEKVESNIINLGLFTLQELKEFKP